MTDADQDTGLRYDRMVEDALRGVVRQALTYAADNGLPGEHHFYITFRTDYPGVDIPAHLHERYPSEMTIVLQYQFWDLKVKAEFFEVTLSFADVPEQLHVPYDAVVSFADPAVRFGLQFESGEDLEEGADAGGYAPATEESGERAPGEAAQPEDARSGAGEAKEDKAGGASSKDTSSEDGDSEDSRQGNEKVVTLDHFRKKQT
jgi:hypothetical protein